MIIIDIITPQNTKAIEKNNDSLNDIYIFLKG
jgi:hypothetical protein